VKRLSGYSEQVRVVGSDCQVSQSLRHRYGEDNQEDYVC